MTQAKALFASQASHLAPASRERSDGEEDTRSLLSWGLILFRVPFRVPLRVTIRATMKVIL